MLRRMYPYWRPTLAETAAGIVLLLVAAGLELLQPWPIKWLVDYVLGQQQPPAWLVAWWPAFGGGAIGHQILGVCLAVLALALLHKGAQLASQYLLIRAGGRIVARLRADVCAHLHRLSLTFHDENRVGDSIYRAAYDTTAALTLVSQALAPVLSGVCILIGTVVVMLGLDPWLTAVSLAVTPCFWLLIRLFGRAIRQRAETYQERERHLVSILQESLASIRLVQAFSREPEISQRVDTQAKSSLTALQRQVFVQLAFAAGVGLAMAVGTALLIGLGAWRVVEGMLSVGDVLVFLAYLGLLYQPMNAFSESANVIQTAQAQLQRVFEVLEMQPQVADRPDARTLARVEGRVVFDKVHFAYEAPKPVLRGIDMQVEPGQVVALVGRTGAGKTTLASLLMRFYDPTEGAISLDGQDLRHLQLAWLRRQISVVLQDTLLFSGSVADNIAYAQPEASRAQIEQAAEQAQAAEFIDQLPQGYDTLLGERGVNLSTGQRQRLAIARAFVKDAPILVLDEPTSALDATTEQALIAALERLVKGRTVFIIAHRLTTVRFTDRIYVLEAGQVVESGSHEHLLAGETRYRQLYRAASGAGETA